MFEIGIIFTNVSCGLDHGSRQPFEVRVFWMVYPLTDNFSIIPVICNFSSKRKEYLPNKYDQDNKKGQD